jgi:hypothetical protein
MELIEDLDPEEARAIVDPALKIQPPRRRANVFIAEEGDNEEGSELKNMIERAMVVSTGARLRLDLAMAFGSSRSTVSDHEKENPNSSNAKIIKSDDLKRLERDSIVAALVRAHHRISGTGGAAELLGVNPKYACLANAFARNQPQESRLISRDLRLELHGDIDRYG